MSTNFYEQITLVVLSNSDLNNFFKYIENFEIYARHTHKHTHDNNNNNRTKHRDLFIRRRVLYGFYLNIR